MWQRSYVPHLAYGDKKGRAESENIQAYMLVMETKVRSENMLMKL